MIVVISGVAIAFVSWPKCDVNHPAFAIRQPEDQRLGLFAPVGIGLDQHVDRLRCLQAWHKARRRPGNLQTGGDGMFSRSTILAVKTQRGPWPDILAHHPISPAQFAELVPLGERLRRPGAAKKPLPPRTKSIRFCLPARSTGPCDCSGSAPMTSYAFKVSAVSSGLRSSLTWTSNLPLSKRILRTADRGLLPVDVRPRRRR